MNRLLNGLCYPFLLTSVCSWDLCGSCVDLDDQYNRIHMKNNHVCRHKHRTDKKELSLETHEGIPLSHYAYFIILNTYLFASHVHPYFCRSMFYHSSYECAISALNNVHYFYQFRWRLYKKASQVFYLHFALKRREFLEEFHEKQEQVSFSGNWFPDLLFSVSPIIPSEPHVRPQTVLNESSVCKIFNILVLLN